MTRLEFPWPFEPYPGHRAGRMMLAGRVKVTVTEQETGKHITVLLKAFADNRKRQYSSDINKNWVECPSGHATHIFCEVPNQGDWADKIGTYYPKNGKFYEDDNADPARVAAAKMAAWWVQDEYKQELLVGYVCQEANECALCGKELTDPESIARGIGPVCFGKMTGSQHQIKDLSAHREAKEENLVSSEELAEPGSYEDPGSKWNLEADMLDKVTTIRVPLRLGSLSDAELLVFYTAVSNEVKRRTPDSDSSVPHSPGTMRPDPEPEGSGDLLGR